MKIIIKGGLDSIFVLSRRPLTNSLPTKFDLPDLLGRAFVDHEHDAVVGGLVAFANRDLGVVVAVAMVEIDELAAGFLDGIGIDRAADFEIRFLGELFVADAVVAQVLDVANDGPLDDFEDHDAAGRRLLVGRLDVDEPAREQSLRTSRWTRAGSNGRPTRVCS